MNHGVHLSETSVIDGREFIGDLSTIKGIQLMTKECFALKVLMPRVSPELMRQIKFLHDSYNNDGKNKYTNVHCYLLLKIIHAI